MCLLLNRSLTQLRPALSLNRHCLALIRLRSNNTPPEKKGQDDDDEEEISEEPIKYTTSDAHLKWKSAYNFRTSPEDEDEEDPRPWYQHYVVKGSLAVFMIYFFYLREENDIDEKLYRPLFETVPHVEKPMIISTIESWQKLGKDTSELEARLREIEAAEAALTKSGS